MPVSTGTLISTALTEIIKLAPESILDVGCGFGLWGFLSRLYLDVFPGRRYKDEWTVRIEGVEAFPKYIMPHQKFLYDAIHSGKIEDMVDRLGNFDLYIFGDVLEHLSKETAVQVLETACRNANKGVLINIPLGEGWLRESSGENEYEAHLSVWELEDFLEYCPKVCGTATFPALGHYATVLIDGTLSEAQKADMMYCNGVLCFQKHAQFASRCFNCAIEMGYDNPGAHFELSRLLIEQKKAQEAVRVLRDAIASFPHHEACYDLLAKLLRTLNRKHEADVILGAKPREPASS
jgi:SAM-dependent methyltransferase